MPSEMTEELDPVSEQLALHEAGHAVAAIVLGFVVREIRFEELGEGEWVGYADNTAADVSPSDPDPVKRRDAAAVALAGREGRRTKYPDDDAAWRPFERSDILKAVGVLGASAVDAEDLLRPIRDQAQQLISAHHVAVQEVATAILLAGFGAGLPGDLIHAIVERRFAG